MSEVGIIDIGTNTVLCLKASIDNDDIAIIFDSRFHYRAGRRLDEYGNISAEYKTGLRRALVSAMSTLTDCTEVKIVATEVLRKPKDGSSFASELAREIGQPIEVIDPQREAELSFFGATYEIASGDEKVTMIDVGGGSAELATGIPGELARWSSVKLGAVAISEAVGYEKNLDDYLEYAEEVFEKSDFIELLTPKPSLMLLVGGSAVTLAGILDGQEVFQPDRIQGFEIRRDILELLLANLSTMSLAERKEIMAFDEPRAEIIVPGGAIILAFMKKYEFRAAKVSAKGLRHGLLLEHFG